MQGLNSGIGSLHTNLSSLDQSLAVSVPKAASRNRTAKRRIYTIRAALTVSLRQERKQLKEKKQQRTEKRSVALNSGAEKLCQKEL